MSWQVAKLSDVCEFHNGLWKGEKGPFVNVGVIRNTNFAKDGMLDDSDIAYLDVESKKFEKRRLQFGDIILEKSGGGPKQAVGRVAFFDKKSGDYSFSNFTSAIRVRDPKALSAEYLHRFLHWQYLSGVTESMQSHSTGIRNLDGGAYKAIEVAFPDISGQHRIVALLDEAFAGIATAKANAERSLRSSREVLDSAMQTAFANRQAEWRNLRLDEVCRLINGRAYKKEEMLRNGKYPLLRVGNFFTNNEWYYSDLELDADKYCDNEDLLYAWSASFGPRIWRGGKVIYHYHIWKVVHDEAMVSRDFLFRLLEWDVEQIKAVHGAGSTMLHVGKGSMDARVLPIPPLSHQSKIVSMLDALQAETQRLESLYTRKLAALDELKQSLLQRAFSGNL